jgi:hypothetical protein
MPIKNDAIEQGLFSNGVKWLTSTCKANDRPYVPSHFQLLQYCTSIDHKKCPFYLSLHEYKEIAFVT